ncbi:MAG: beta-N-acetylhexosaminidase [Bacteroidales bacterium]|nr:beta-N-acetylhexosaminidase [Bacteroidales bacterium]
MKNLRKPVLAVAAIFAASFIFAFDSEKIMDKKISVIPEPVLLKEGVKNSSPVAIDKNSVLLLASGECDESVRFLNSYLKKYYGFSLKVAKSAKKASSVISLSIDREGVKRAFIEADKQPGKQYDFSDIIVKPKQGAYFLSAENGSIKLIGADVQGLFYAVQSLIQLLPVEVGVRPDSDINKTVISEITVPAVEIYDYPRFEYRGMHLDVVRHIFSVDYIKQYIDYLALHKMNYFHLHLTDDQSWRIESKKYPKLNSIGSWRDGTIIGIFPGTGVDSTRYGGFYTVEQLKDIVKYAAERQITIVPEIDVPGHSMAIIASYPQFSTTPDIPKKTAITWGIYNRQNNVLAPSDDVFVFLADVFNELMDIFPGPYIHIGADECAKRWWKESASTQEYMRSKGLKDENELQKYFVERISEVVTARGRKIVGWDEMIDDGLVPGSIVMSWRNEKGGLKAAKMGHKAIMTPMVNSYFNIAQREGETNLAHKSWLTTLDSVYLFEPIPDGFPEEAAANVLGGQGCMWTEYFANKEQVEYGIFPRLSAISEVYWSPRESRNIVKFREKLQNQYKRYDLWGANYYSGERK